MTDTAMLPDDTVTDAESTNILQGIATDRAR